MISFFTRLYQNLDEFIPGGPNKKFILTFIVFFIWLAIFDKNRWITQWQLQKTIYKYEHMIESLDSEIVTIKKKRKDLNSDIEKFARETYLMKKSDEELFIIAAE